MTYRLRETFSLICLTDRHSTVSQLCPARTADCRTGATCGPTGTTPGEGHAGPETPSRSVLQGNAQADPKTPGRKPGDPYGPKAQRPLPEQKPDEIIDVPLPRECPDCGGLAEEDHVEQQFQVEIPRQPSSVGLTSMWAAVAAAADACSRVIRCKPRTPWGRRVAVGPDVQALIALMKDKYGLSYGDIQGLLDEAFGISVRRGGAAQVVLRVAERHEPAYEAIQQMCDAAASSIRTKPAGRSAAGCNGCGSS